MATDSSGKKKVLITGGGSGGHLNPAIALIEHFREHNSEIFEDLVFLGGNRGMIADPTPSLESRRIPELGIKFIGIRTGKLHRRFGFTQLRLLVGVIGGYFDARRVLRLEQPDVVFATGGYVSLPVVIAASQMGITSVLHEQTTSPGLANRWAARWADKILLSFPDNTSEFPAEKTVVTGNPILPNRFATELPSSGQLVPEYREFLEAIPSLKSSGHKFLFITGGGLGAHVLNDWLVENLAELVEQNFIVLIQTGSNKYYSDYEDLKKLKSKLSLATQKKFFVIESFGSEIGFIYTHVDVVVARPGANTIQELLARSCKAALVPIPWSSGGEQQKNAEYFVKNQTGVIIAQSEINRQLKSAVIKLLGQTAKTSTQLVERNAVELIARELLK